MDAGGCGRLGHPPQQLDDGEPNDSGVFSHSGARVRTLRVFYERLNVVSTRR
jgi:hypothetical protein